MDIRDRGKFGLRYAAPRRYLATRVPLDHAERLMAAADATGLTVSEYLAKIVAEDITRSAAQDTDAA